MYHPKYHFIFEKSPFYEVHLYIIYCTGPKICSGIKRQRSQLIEENIWKRDKITNEEV